jgi:hypothetical protein
MRRSDCGTERSDTRGRQTGDTPLRGRQSHARLKCAASPCYRTFHNARTRRTRLEPPRRKSASRRFGNARDAVLSLPPGSPWHLVGGNGGDYRYDRPDITKFSPPGRRLEGYVRTYCNGKFLLRKFAALCTIKQWVVRIAGYAAD